MNLQNQQSIDWSKTLIRCSALGNIMTEPRAKTEVLSQTCKTYLRQLYREKKYGRRKEFTSKYTEKGLNVEEDAITLYSRIKKIMFKKNDVRLTNEFISGEPDIYEGESIHMATSIIDTKSSWDLFTLPFKDDGIDKGYYYQLQGYMALTGAQSATLAYCLINTPKFLIDKEVKSLFWKTGVEPDAQAIERLTYQMTFDDIPMKERFVEFSIPRDEAAIGAIELKVAQCRDYLITLSKQF